MKNIITSVILAASCASAFAQAEQPAQAIEREKPAFTPAQVVDGLSGYSTNSAYNTGFIDGQTLATAKLLEMLYSLRLTSLPVCFPAISNGTLKSVIRDQLITTVMPQNPAAANADEWDTAAIALTAIATLQRFPCR